MVRISLFLGDNITPALFVPQTEETQHTVEETLEAEEGTQKEKEQ